jgi:DNA-binding MarR family transcriptional regulator
MVSRMTATRDRHVADDAIATVEQQFAIMFTRVKATMRGRAHRVHPGLQVLSFNVLSALVRLGPTHAGEVGELLNLDKSIISRQATQLEELGLLERQRDSEDRRATYLAATEVGIERITKVREAEQAVLYDNLRDWDVDDLDKLAELLARLNALV